jgi:hypothetical protein
MAQTTLVPVAFARSVFHDERYADRRDHEQEGVVAGPALDCGWKLRCHQSIHGISLVRWLGRCGAPSVKI